MEVIICRRLCRFGIFGTYDRFAQINRIDQAIYEAENEVAEGAEPVALDTARASLDMKYYGKI